MDRVFGGYGGFYFDPYYNARRDATTLVAVTCRDPRSTCFCSAIGGSPSGTEGVDLLLTQVEGGFTAEAVTTKGEALLAFDGFAEAESGQAEAAAGVKETAAGAVDVPFTLDGLREALKANFEDPRWHDLAMRCISCGTCTYVCPNCYCFTIMDEAVEIEGERFRAWDNCFNPIYTLEASGHNPRDARPAASATASATSSGTTRRSTTACCARAAGAASCTAPRASTSARCCAPSPHPGAAAADGEGA